MPGQDCPSAPGPPVRVSVVIPVRDDAHGIGRCLAGLRRQNFPLEILVVDDGSRDDSAGVAAAGGAEVIRLEGRGAAAARNAGLQAAQGEIVLFTDADCIPCPGWARSLLEPLTEGRAIATKGAYRTRQLAATPRFVQQEYEERYDRMRGFVEIDFLDTYSLAVRRVDLVAIGGFDESFSGASVEDQEMSFRLRERGRFAFVAGAVVEHRHADTPLRYFRKKLRIGRGKATLWRRHRSCLKGDSHTPDSLRLQVPAVFLAIPLLFLSLFLPALWIPAFLALISPLLLSLPLVRRVFGQEGVGLAIAAAGLCVVRGWALGLGFGIGVVAPLAQLGQEVDTKLVPPGDGGLPVPEPMPTERDLLGHVEAQERVEEKGGVQQSGS